MAIPVLQSGFKFTGQTESTTIQVTKPDSVSDGDLLVAMIASDGAETFAPPDNFGDLLSIDGGSTDKHFRHTGFTSTINDSYAAPDSFPEGITWDATNVLSSNSGSPQRHYKHSGFSSTIDDSYTYPTGSVRGLLWDGTNVRSSAVVLPRRVRLHSGFSTTITDSFVHPVIAGAVDLAWDNPNLLSAVGSANPAHFLHSGFSATITDSYQGPDTSKTGIGWDGTNVFSTGSSTDKNYLHSLFSATITDSFATTGSQPQSVGSTRPLTDTQWAPIAAVVVAGSGGGSNSSQMWWKNANATEPANYTWTISSNEEATLAMVRITGHKAGNPIDIFTNTTGTSDSPTCPDLTTLSVDTLILRFYGADDDDQDTDAGFEGTHTGVYNRESSSTSGSCSSGLMHKDQAAIASVGTAAFTNLASEDWSAWTVAIASIVVSGRRIFIIS